MSALPVLIPIVTIVFSLLFYRNVKIKKLFGLAGTILLLIVSIIILDTVQRENILVMQAGGWAAPFGISLVIDLFSAIMLVISGIIGVCCAFYSFTAIDANRHKYNYFIFFHAILLGVNGSFITGDVFNLYVWIEVFLMASFGLLLLGAGEKQLKAGIKYLTMNVIASIFFLAGIAVLYGQTGTLNMADLALLFSEERSVPFSNLAAILFFLALGIKAALFPFFYWLPASYHTLPVAVTAFFAGLLTKVGVYAFIRMYTLFFTQYNELWSTVFLVTASFTMVIGVFAAASQNDLRRILSFHIISQIGYMIMGLGIFTPLAIAGSIYFMAHNIFAKSNAFLISGLINHKYGSYSLNNLGNLYKEAPVLAFLFLIPAFALAGFPPLSGFIGKFILVKAGFDAEHYFIAAVSLVVSLVTLFSMVKIWNAVFLKKREGAEARKNTGPDFNFYMIFPVVFLACMSVALGIGAGYFVNLCMDAANQLMDKSVYIEGVLN